MDNRITLREVLLEKIYKADLFDITLAVVVILVTLSAITAITVLLFVIYSEIFANCI